MVVKDRKATLQALHTDTIDKAVKSHERNVVLNGRPPSISNSEKRPYQERTLNPCSTKIRILWTHTRTESRRMRASTSVQTAA